jgi:stage V sporulation protein SpoVS
MDKAAAATHLAAKTLAVARFYLNTQMAAAGAAGVRAAAALVGLQGKESTGEGSGVQEGRLGKDEVLFVPYHHKAGADGTMSSASGDMDSFGFVVSTAPADTLPVKLPSPVGPPQSMVNTSQLSQITAAAAAASTSAPLLKASAQTDINRLSNALIHHLMDSGHVALQLAGAAACHVAMEALVKARLRLERKFNSGLVACAAFANEDTSNALGRSTVFLRLDVLRCGRDLHLLGPEAAGALAVAAQSAWDL